MKERHDILERTIGYLDPEQEALDQGILMLKVSFPIIIIGCFLEALFFYLYNGPCHPFSNILKDPEVNDQKSNKNPSKSLGPIKN